MLVICNGLYKSGSTWMFTMLLELFEQDNLPKHWTMKDQPRNVGVFRAASTEVFDHAKDNHLASKLHLYHQESLEYLKRKNCSFVVTVRPLPDILISHHHHFCNEKFKIPFILYLFSIGMLKGFEVSVYRKIVINSSYCNVLVEFDDMKATAADTVKRVVRDLQLRYSTNEVEAAAKKEDLRGKSFKSKFRENKDRSWFLTRSDTTGRVSLAMAKMVSRFIEKASSFNSISKLVTMLLLSTRQSKTVSSVQ